MVEGIIMGIIQGIAEWIPVSSEGMTVLAEINIFGRMGIEEIIRFAFFLHLGTFFAALIYFWKDVRSVLVSLFYYKTSSAGEKRILHFLVISTVISGILGFGLLSLLGQFEKQVEFSGRLFTVFIGTLLLLTAWLQLKSKKDEHRRGEKEAGIKDSLILGLAQGLAVLPGLSRSGLTVSALLFRKFEDESALRLSYLMSLPIVLFGNIILNFDVLKNLENISAAFFWGFLFSFIFGFLTISFLMRFAKKVSFGYFAGIFGFLMVLAAFL